MPGRPFLQTSDKNENWEVIAFARKNILLFLHVTTIAIPNALEPSYPQCLPLIKHW